ncbi:MAG: beta-glucoside-specific PTS transporter subunit IIABC [Gordonia sp. (in: high G+C Gram-positive bacteria)]
MDYSTTAAGVLKGVGGEENVASLVHCATRLRFTLKDRTKVDTAAVRATDGVITTAEAGGLYQVVIGNDVPEVYEAIRASTRLGSAASVGGDTKAEAPSGNLFNRVIKMVSEIFTPLLWTLAGTGLLKAFLAASVTFGWIDNTGSNYVILNAISDAFMHFLPFALAITAARYFKASEFTSLALAGAMLYPAIAELATKGGAAFIGISFTMVNFTSSVIPIIIAVWLQSHAEKFLYAKLPSAIRRFVTPMIVILVFGPLIFLVIGPISNFVSSGIADGIHWLFEFAPWLGGALMGGLWQVFVIFGVHWGFVPLMTLEYQTTGKILLMAPGFAAVIAQGAAAAGVWVRTRDSRLRSLAAPAALSGLLAGVTEPAIYGVTLPLKRPFAFGIVGGLIGGAIISAGGVSSNSFALPSLLSLPSLIGSGNTVLMFLGIAVALVVPFVLTIVIGFKQPTEETPDTTTQAVDSVEGEAADGDSTIASPLDGTVVPLSDVPDEAFASGKLGQGVAIEPKSGALFAPFDGKVVMAFPTGHAIGLRDAYGLELLIHVGIDTVKLAGAHFSLKVAAGQQVRSGDLLLEFDVEEIAAAGYRLTTPVLVTNGAKFPTVANTASGPIAHGDPLFIAIAKATEPSA